MKKTTRRTFVQASAATAVLGPALRARGANEAIRLGFIGVGGRGGGSASWFSKEKDARIATLCDADAKRAAGVARKFKGSKSTTDLRKVIDDPDIDAVVISTPNHWHCLAAIWAAQAGKDVYVEKPISHNIWEGHKLVEAARKYKRMVQGGTQQRSDPLQAELKSFLDSGALGKIQFVRLNRFGVRGSIGKRDTPLPPPKDVDYDLWLGPAQEEPMYRKSFHYDWHWIWNTGNGELGNWGPHITDDCRNVVFRDKVSLPVRVCAGGGRFAWNDGGESPNTHFVYYDTGTVPVVMAIHNLPLKKGTTQGDVYARLRTRGFLVIQCENGYYAGGRGGGAAFDNNGKVVKKFKGDGGRGHARNFLGAMRSRKSGDLKAEIEQIHYSSAWCHLGNIAYRLGGSSYDRAEAMGRVKGYKPWEELVEGFHTHLAANEIDAARAKIKLGPMLQVDPAAETFTGASATPEALALLRREYRKGYVVPEQV